MKKLAIFFYFLFFAFQAFSGDFKDFYGTWGFTNTRGKLITAKIGEKSVEFNAYQVDSNGIIDFDNFPDWMLDNLDSELVVVSKESVLFPHQNEARRGLLKFQPIDATKISDFYLYLDSSKQFHMKTVGFTDSPTLEKIIDGFGDSGSMTEATFYKIR